MRQAIVSDGGGLPDDELSRRSGYDDGSAHSFLRRAWIELFPTTPLPGEPTHAYAALYIILHGYYDIDFQYASPDDLKQLTARPEHEQGAYLRQFKAELRDVILGANPHDDPAFLKREIGYRDTDQQTFARRIWTEIYPNEPVPSAD